MTGLQQVFTIAFSSDERLDTFFERRSEVGQLWNIQLSDDERVILDALPIETIRELSKKNPDLFNIGPINLLQAILAKAASSQEFEDNLIELKGDISQKHSLSISEDDKFLLNSIPSSQYRLMIKAVKSSRSSWLATFGKLSILGITIFLSLMILPDSGMKVFGNRPGQTLDDYFQQNKILGSKMRQSPKNKSRRDIVKRLESEFGIRVYVSPEIKVSMDEVPTVNSDMVGDLLSEVFSVDRFRVFYANQKIMVE